MVKVEISLSIQENPNILQTSVLFVCATVNRAKQIVNEGGHVAGRDEQVNNDTGWTHIGSGIHVAQIVNYPGHTYVISPVDYAE